MSVFSRLWCEDSVVYATRTTPMTGVFFGPKIEARLSQLTSNPWAFKSKSVLLHDSGLAFVQRGHLPVLLDKATSLIHLCKSMAIGHEREDILLFQADLLHEATNLFEKRKQG